MEAHLIIPNTIRLENRTLFGNIKAMDKSRFNCGLRRALLVVTLTVVTLADLACVDVLGHAESEVGVLEGDCILPSPHDIPTLGAPVSLEYPDGSLWIWGLVERADGQLVESVAAFVESTGSVCSDGPALFRDAEGAPIPFLSLTEEERAENDARTDGRRVTLSAAGGFVHQGRGYLFYDEVLLAPGSLDGELLGTGLCVVEPGGTRCRRVVAGGSMLLWPAGRRVLNQGGLVVDGRALVYGCRKVASLHAVCTIAGAPLDRLEEPSAYEAWNAFNGWTEDQTDATEPFEEFGPVTVSRWGRGVLATAIDPFSGEIHVRRAPSALDKFDRQIAAFFTAPTSEPFIAGGREHAGLREAPDTIVVSYQVTGGGGSELHLATYRFFGEETGAPYQSGETYR
jgi:hypothetical protein